MLYMYTLYGGGLVSIANVSIDDAFLCDHFLLSELAFSIDCRQCMARREE